MSATWMVGRSALRGRWWGTVAVALLIGIAGAAVLGALAGARRTETAYPRLLEAENVGDLAIGTQGIGHVPVGAVRHLPHVEWAEPRSFFVLASRNDDGRIVFNRDLGAATAGGSSRPVELYQRDRAQMLDGRLPDPRRVDEAAVNEIFVRNRGLGIGDTFRAWVYTFDDVVPLVDRARALGRDPTSAELRPAMTPVTFHITGIARTNSDLLLDESQSNDTIFASPAFVRKHRDKALLTGVSVKLDDPERNTVAFEHALRKELPDLNLSVDSTATSREQFVHVAGPYADALRIFALVAALTAAFVLAQALARLVAADAADALTLDALGATRRQRSLASAARAVVAVLLGAALALAGAYALSTIFPFGRVRDAEPQPGLRFDAAAMLLGVAAMVLLLVAFTLVVAALRVRRAARAHDNVSYRPSRAVALLGRRGASVGVVAGVGFAVQRDRRTAGSSLAASLVGVIAAIGVTAAAITFATNLDDLMSSPSRYGWNWSATIHPYSEDASTGLTDRLRADHELTGMTVGSRASVVVGARAIPAYSFERVRGHVRFGLPAGRMPRNLHEVALGRQTMRDLQVSIGDRLSIPTAAGSRLRLRVVGQALMPFAATSAYGVSEGMILDPAALQRVDPSARAGFVLVDFAPGVTRKQVALRYAQEANTYGPSRPGDLVAYERVQATPVVLAWLLAVLAAGVLAHVLVTSVRARRRELAVLKTLGFTRWQVAASIAWMATTVVVVALAIGLPLGIVLGRWTWRSFADDLGIDERVLLPGLALLLLALAALALGNLVAVLPARSAARTRPAVVLRSE